MRISKNLGLQVGGKYREGENGLWWDDPDNPYNGSDYEEGGDLYESYKQGYYYDEDEDKGE